MDELFPNTKEAKHEAILKTLKEELDKELQMKRYGVPDHAVIVHLQNQIAFHRDQLLSEE